MEINRDYIDIKFGDGGYSTSTYKNTEEAKKAIIELKEKQKGGEYESYYENMTYRIIRHIELEETIDIVKK